VPEPEPVLGIREKAKQIKQEIINRLKPLQDKKHELYIERMKKRQVRRNHIEEKWDLKAEWKKEFKALQAAEEAGDLEAVAKHKQRIKELKVELATVEAYIENIGQMIVESELAESALKPEMRQELINLIGHGKDTPQVIIDYLSKFAADDVRAQGIIDGLAFVQEMVDPDVIPASDLKVKKGGKGASHYQPWEDGGIIDVIHMSSGAAAATMAHEMGHWIEEWSDIVHGNILAFLEQEVGLSNIKPVKQKQPFDVVDPDYYKSLDSWDRQEVDYTRNTYMTKYGVQTVNRSLAAGELYATELFSQFLDMAYGSPHLFMEMSDDYFSCMYACAQGVVWQ
jgi:hypothetical protein